MLKVLFSFFILLNASAAIDVGTSLNSAMQGRVVPSLYIGLDEGTRHISFHSTGVATELYYHNVYTLSYYIQDNFGEFLFTNLVAGAGIGVMYAKLGYREDKGAQEESADDFVFGPGLRFEFSH
jgi:hypothetical protein